MTPTLLFSLCIATSSAMALQSLFLGFALIGRPALRSHANTALAIGSFAFAFAMVRDIIHDGGWDDDVPYYLWAATKLPILLIPPSAYLHIIGLTSKTVWRFHRKDLWHYVFCLAGVVIYAAGVALDSSFLLRNLQNFTLLVTVLQGGYCLATGFRLTRRNDSPRFAWLRLLLWGLTGFLILHATINAIGIIVGDLPWARLTAHVSALLLLYSISWGSLGHGKAFERMPDQVFHDLVAAPLQKYRKSRQSAEEAQRILAKLDQAILTQSLYREADLTLPMLAAKVGAKSNIVSQALNQTLGVSFFDYINDHRIAEAKRMLLSADEPDATILDIAYSVGFNSKSTFNAAFKKRTGQTPSEYRKQTFERTGL